MSPASRRPLSDEDRAAKVDALVERLNTAVEELAIGREWTAMLRASATFSSYSFRNMMLLWKQADERDMTLTAVAGFRAWKAMGRSVRKGERGLAILAPRTRRSDDTTEVDGPGQVMCGVRVVHVFDLSQTEGAPLPDAPRPAALTGEDSSGLFDSLAGLVRAEGYAVGRVEFDDQTLWSRADHTDRSVSIRHDLGDVEASAALSHQLGHILADHANSPIPRDQMETEAESIAYVVMGAHGIDIGSSSVPSVTGWSSGDVQILAAAAETVHRVAAGIVDDLAASADSTPSAAPATPARRSAVQRATAERSRQTPQASR